MKLLAVVTVNLLLISPAVAQNVLSAEPTVRVDSGEGATTRRILTSVEQAKSRVIIIKQGSRYLWASREGLELVHHISGNFDYFVNPGGSGYVKVIDTHKVPVGLRLPGPRFRFMEHVSLGLGTITYWGATEGFRLEPDR